MVKHNGSKATALLLATLCSGLLISHQVAAKAIRDALFLSTYAPNLLPKLMFCAALLELPLVLIVARLMARFGPQRLVPGLLLTSSLLHVLEWWLYRRAPGLNAIIVYLDVSSLGAATISGFWAIVTERFNPHQARKAVSVIALGSAVGGLVGGLLAERVGSVAGLDSLLLCLAGVSLLAAFLLMGLARSWITVTSSTPARSASIPASSYVQNIAALVVLTAFGSTFVDYAFKVQAGSTLGSGVPLLRFFAVAYMGTSLVTVLLQLGLVRPALHHIGIGGTLVILPAAAIVLGVLALSIPGIWSFTLLRAAEAALEQSFFRSAYEPLYTPLVPAVRRAAKTVIDVGGARFGQILASGAVLLFGSYGPERAVAWGLVVAILVAGFCIWLGVLLQRGYIAELEESLRNGHVELDAAAITDRTTRFALSQTNLNIDRKRLLVELREIEHCGSYSGVEPSNAANMVPAGIAAAVQDLVSGDIARARKQLLARSLDPRLIAFAIPLLEVDELSELATLALKSTVAQGTGQLVDVLLDASSSVKLRRRVPAVLAAAVDARAVQGLVEGLSDSEFVVRRRVARALQEIVTRFPHLRPPAPIVIELARRELKLDQQLNQIPQAERLEHIFTLLSLVLDNKVLDGALAALLGKNDRLRGTALEYLENVLPDSLRAELWTNLRSSQGQPSATEQTAAT